MKTPDLTAFTQSKVWRFDRDRPQNIKVRAP
jgi:hypothetical protein